MLNKNNFAKTFIGLCEMFDKKPSENLTSIYYEAIKGLSEEEFSRAVSNIIQNHLFSKLPLPAEFLDSVRGSANERALLALRKVERAMKEHGQYVSVVFDDKIIHAVVMGLGGWEKLCSETEDNWRWIQKDFISNYITLEKIHPSHLETPERLIGIHERQNNSKGIDKFQIAYVGKKQKAIENKKELIAQ